MVPLVDDRWQGTGVASEAPCDELLEAPAKDGLP